MGCAATFEIGGSASIRGGNAGESWMAGTLLQNQQHASQFEKRSSPKLENNPSESILPGSWMLWVRLPSTAEREWLVATDYKHW
jgi:hypothetical protein